MLHLSSSAPQQSFTCWVTHRDSVVLFSCFDIAGSLVRTNDCGYRKQIAAIKRMRTKHSKWIPHLYILPRIHIDIRVTSSGGLPQSREMSHICAYAKTSSTYWVPINPWFGTLVHTTTASGLRSSCCLHEVGPRPWSKMQNQCFKPLRCFNISVELISTA